MIMLKMLMMIIKKSSLVLVKVFFRPVKKPTGMMMMLMMMMMMMMMMMLMLMLMMMLMIARWGASEHSWSFGLPGFKVDTQHLGKLRKAQLSNAGMSRGMDLQGDL